MPCRSRGKRGGDAKPSTAGLSLRPRRRNPPRRCRNLPCPRRPAHGSKDVRSTSPPLVYANIVPQHQEKSGSGSESELELDSPPRITWITEPEDQEPPSPTSPYGSSPSIDMNPAVSPKGYTSGPATEEWHSSDAEEDPYFESLAENFVAAADVGKSALSEDDSALSEDDFQEIFQRNCNLYAETALKHYNSDKKNKIKYKLVSAIWINDMLDKKGWYGHANFTAKGHQRNSKEKLFFAELRIEDNETYVTTCVLPLEGGKVGGLYDSVYDNNITDKLEKGSPLDDQHCYACGKGLKHPKNGLLYQGGHVAIGDYYRG